MEGCLKTIRHRHATSRRPTKGGRNMGIHGLGPSAFMGQLGHHFRIHLLSRAPGRSKGHRHFTRDLGRRGVRQTPGRLPGPDFNPHQKRPNHQGIAMGQAHPTRNPIPIDQYGIRRAKIGHHQQIPAHRELHVSPGKPPILDPDLAALASAHDRITFRQGPGTHRAMEPDDHIPVVPAPRPSASPGQRLPRDRRADTPAPCTRSSAGRASAF